MRLVWITLGWSLGLVLAAGAAQRMPLLWLAMLLPALAAAWLLLHHPRRWLAILLVALAAGGFRLSLVPATTEITRWNDSGGLTLTGVVASAPDIDDENTGIRLDVESVTQGGTTTPASGQVLVHAAPGTQATYGDRVRATGLLITPGQSDSFDYAGYLALSGIFSLQENATVETVSAGNGNPLYALLLGWRERAFTLITQALPEPQAGLLAAMLLGDERGLSPDLQDDFAATGAAHLIAISGFNMVIVSQAVMRMLDYAHVRPNRAAVLGIGFIILYMLLVGAGPAVVRAALMSSLLVIGERLRRRTFVPASLALVALVTSALNPLVLWDTGFQLSMAGALGLSLFANPLADWLEGHSRRWLLRPARALLIPGLATTIAAQITVVPLIALYFGRLSLVILPVNLLLLPVQSLLLLSGAAATLVSAVVPAIGQLLFWVAFAPLAWMTALVSQFARLPFADVAFVLPPALVALFFGGLAAWVVLKVTQPRWKFTLSGLIQPRTVQRATLFAGAGMLALSITALGSRPDGQLHLWLLDVGRGNALLARTPGGAHILIDGGNAPSRLLQALGERLPFTTRDIDVLAITQPDEADTGALIDVLSRYNIGLVLTNGQPNLGDTFAALQERSGSATVRVAQAGMTLDFSDGARLDVLHPAAVPELDDPLNSHPLVLRLRYGDVSLLLTGDLNVEAQQAMIQADAGLQTAVLQVPQHGRRGALDAAFLAAVIPQVALVQAESGNRRGEPDADTLALLGDVPLFRTDQGGTVHLWSDGHDVWVVQEG